MTTKLPVKTGYGPERDSGARPACKAAVTSPDVLNSFNNGVNSIETGSSRPGSNYIKSPMKATPNRVV